MSLQLSGMQWRSLSVPQFHLFFRLIAFNDTVRCKPSYAQTRAVSKSSKTKHLSCIVNSCSAFHTMIFSHGGVMRTLMQAYWVGTVGTSCLIGSRLQITYSIAPPRDRALCDITNITDKQKVWFMYRWEVRHGKTIEHRSSGHGSSSQPQLPHKRSIMMWL